MIRSSRHSLKYANVGKADVLTSVIQEYRRFLQTTIDDAWNNGIEEWGVFPLGNALDFKGKSLLTTQRLKRNPTWLSARAQQAAGKQAVMMLKAATEKRRKQLWTLGRLQREGVQVGRLQSKIDRQPLVKPNASRANMELDSRFVDFQEEGVFIFLRLKCLGKKIQLRIPIKRTAPSRKWSAKGTRKLAVRVADDSVSLLYDVKNAPITGQGTLGADQGVTTTLTLSSGVATRQCPHGHDLSSIQQKLARCTKGSRGFQNAQDHRKNYVGWSLNQLRPALSSAREVRLERIRDLRMGRRSSRFLSHWAYTLIKDKIVLLSEEEGFLLREVSNAFRSQRCSSCGWVRKSNRKGKTFKCGECGHTADADLNAAVNLSVDLYEVPFWVRQKQLNRRGFFWKHDGLFDSGQESIVPDAREDGCGNEMPHLF